MSVFWKRFCFLYSLVFFLMILLAEVGAIILLSLDITIDVNDASMPLIHIVYFSLLAIALTIVYLSDNKGVKVLSVMTVIAMYPLINHPAVFFVTVGGYLFIILIKTKVLTSERIIVCYALLGFYLVMSPILLLYNFSGRTVLAEKYSPDHKYYIQEVNNDSGAFGGSTTVVLYEEYLNLGWIRFSGQGHRLAVGNWGTRFYMRWIDDETVSVGGRNYQVSQYSSGVAYGRITDMEKPYTREELLDLYSANNEQFERIAEALRKNEDFYTQKQSTEGEVRLAYNSDSEFFSEEEWAYIKSFFQNVQPMDIKCLEDAVIAFRFAKGEDGFANTLLYVGDGKAEKHFDSYKTDLDAVEKINDQWWLVMRNHN